MLTRRRMNELLAASLFGAGGALLAGDGRAQETKPAPATGAAPSAKRTPEQRGVDPASLKPGELPPIEPGSFSIAVLPDTQIYSEKFPHHFANQTRWIGENAEKRNIRYAVQLGDVTNRNTPEQWEVARDSMFLLDGKAPYAIALGNHDYGPGGDASKRETSYNDYFPFEKYRAWPTFGDAYEPGRLENCWHEFQVGGQKFLILALEWSPRDPVVEWANKVVADRPEHRAILITHAYVYHDETRYDWRGKGAAQKWNPHSYGTAKDPAGANDGEELWGKLVKRHPNFFLTLNGHVLEDGLGYVVSRGDHGNVVHQMLVNYQMKPEGGEGYLRLLEFDAAGESIRVRAFSPSLVESKIDSQNDFTVKLDPPLKLAAK